jgi:hypothetical protein
MTKQIVLKDSTHRYKRVSVRLRSYEGFKIKDIVVINLIQIGTYL